MPGFLNQLSVEPSCQHPLRYSWPQTAAILHEKNRSLIKWHRGTPQVCSLWWLFFPAHTNNINASQRSWCSSSIISGLYIVEFLLRQSFKKKKKGTQEKRDETVRVQPFFFWLNPPSAQKYSTYCWLGVSSFSMHLCVCVWGQSEIVWPGWGWWWGRGAEEAQSWL